MVVAAAAVRVQARQLLSVSVGGCGGGASGCGGDAMGCESCASALENAWGMLGADWGGDWVHVEVGRQGHVGENAPRHWSEHHGDPDSLPMDGATQLQSVVTFSTLSSDHGPGVGSVSDSDVATEDDKAVAEEAALLFTATVNTNTLAEADSDPARAEIEADAILRASLTPMLSLDQQAALAREVEAAVHGAAETVLSGGAGAVGRAFVWRQWLTADEDLVESVGHEALARALMEDVAQVGADYAAARAERQAWDARRLREGVAAARREDGLPVVTPEDVASPPMEIGVADVAALAMVLRGQDLQPDLAGVFAAARDRVWLPRWSFWRTGPPTEASRRAAETLNAEADAARRGGVAAVLRAKQALVLANRAAQAVRVQVAVPLRGLRRGRSRRACGCWGRPSRRERSTA